MAGAEGNTNMKKYERPKMEAVRVDSEVALLVASDDGPGWHGRDNACAHGSHAWFCGGD